MEFRVYHLPSTWMLSPSRKLSKPCSLGIFMEASLHRHDWLLTQSPAPPPSPEDGGWGWKFQASNHTLTFLVPVSILKLSSSPPRVTSLEQKTFLSPREFQGQRPNIFFLLLSLSVLILGKTSCHVARGWCGKNCVHAPASETCQQSCAQENLEMTVALTMTLIEAFQETRKQSHPAKLPSDDDPLSDNKSLLS